MNPPQHNGTKDRVDDGVQIDPTGDLLQAQDPIIRWHAIKAAGEMGDSSASEELLRVLTSPDIIFDESSLHRIAAWALGRIGSCNTQKLMHIFSAVPDTCTQLAIVDTLGEIRDPSAVSLLESCLLSSNEDLQLWSALSLMKIGDAAIPSLLRCAMSGSERMAFLAIDALATIASPTAGTGLSYLVGQRPVAMNTYLSVGPKDRTQMIKKLVSGSSLSDELDLSECKETTDE